MAEHDLTGKTITVRELIRVLEHVKDQGKRVVIKDCYQVDEGNGYSYDEYEDVAIVGIDEQDRQVYLKKE